MSSGGLPRVLFSCVAENDPRWFRMVQNLVLSVRCTGGALADAPFVVNVVGSLEPIWDELQPWNVELRVVQRVVPERATFNKLRMFELAASYEFDTLVAVDCDMVLLGDFAAFVSPSALAAAPANRHRLRRHEWERLCTALGVEVPEHQVVAAVTGELGPGYYNSGLLIARREACEPLRQRWYELGKDLIRLYATDPGLLAEPPGDQISLACAIADVGIAVETLPVNLNVSTKRPKLAAHVAHENGPPFGLHYHNNIGADGFLLRSPRQAVTAQCEVFNRLRAEQLGVPYRGIGDGIPYKGHIHDVAASRFERSARGVARRLRRLLSRTA